MVANIHTQEVWVIIFLLVFCIETVCLFLLLKNKVKLFNWCPRMSLVYMLHQLQKNISFGDDQSEAHQRMQNFSWLGRTTSWHLLYNGNHSYKDQINCNIISCRATDIQEIILKSDEDGIFNINVFAQASGGCPLGFEESIPTKRVILYVLCVLQNLFAMNS